VNPNAAGAQHRRLSRKKASGSGKWGAPKLLTTTSKARGAERQSLGLTELDSDRGGWRRARAVAHREVDRHGSTAVCRRSRDETAAGRHVQQRVGRTDSDSVEQWLDDLNDQIAEPIV